MTPNLLKTQQLIYNSNRELAVETADFNVDDQNKLNSMKKVKGR